MMYLPFIGKVEQLLAKSDQQNLGNDDTRTEDTKQERQGTIYNPKYIYSDIVFYLRKTVSGDSILFHIRK